MTDLSLYNNSGNSDQSPFDSIRRYRADGTEYWCAREILDLLDLDYLMPEKPMWAREKFRLTTNKSILTSEDLGFLLLELSAIFSMQTSLGYACDASYLCELAISIYKGQSATGLFHCVSTQAIQKANSLDNEFAFHQYIQLFWKEMFPFATKIEHEYGINRRSIVDFLLDGTTPVEVKKDPASKQCVNQLLRYMKDLSSPRGYLVAPSACVKLPSNIVFVELTFDEINKRMMPSHIPVKDKLSVRARGYQMPQMQF